MYEAEFQRAVERLHRQVMQAADAAGAIAKRAGFGFRQVNQFVQRVGGHRCVRGDELRRGAHDAHRREILHRIVRQFGIERGVDRGLADIGHQQRVAVGVGARHQFAGADAARAGAVVDDELLFQCFGQARGDQPRHGVGQAARGVGDDDAHRFGGVGLRCGG